MQRFVVAIGALLLVAGEVTIVQRVSTIKGMLSESRQVATDKSVEQKADAVATRAALASQIDDQASKIEKLSLTVERLIPREVGHNHADVRLFMIRSKLAQASNPIVLVGDSITEAALLPSEICGHEIVNAAIGGQDVKSYYSLVASIFHDKAIPIILVALGTNNSWTTSPSADVFSHDYDALMDRLAPYTSTLVVAGIPPIDTSKELGSHFDPALVNSNNDAIKHIASTRGLRFIDLANVMPGNDLTIDGVHLNQDGYKEWTPAIVGALATAINCKPVAQN